MYDQVSDASVYDSMFHRQVGGSWVMWKRHRGKWTDLSVICVPMPGSPWYSCTGWLGVKHQFTYLLTLCQGNNQCWVSRAPVYRLRCGSSTYTGCDVQDLIWTRVAHLYIYSSITQHIGQHSHWVKRGVELGVGLGWCHKHTKLVVHLVSTGGCGIALLSSSFPGKESQLKLLWNEKELDCCFPFLISPTGVLLAAAENLCPRPPSPLSIWCVKVKG